MSRATKRYCVHWGSEGDFIAQFEASAKAMSFAALLHEGTGGAPVRVLDGAMTSGFSLIIARFPQPK